MTDQNILTNRQRTYDDEHVHEFCYIVQVWKKEGKRVKRKIHFFSYMVYIFLGNVRMIQESKWRPSTKMGRRGAIETRVGVYVTASYYEKFEETISKIGREGGRHLLLRRWSRISRFERDWTTATARVCATASSYSTRCANRRKTVNCQTWAGGWGAPCRSDRRTNS